MAKNLAKKDTDERTPAETAKVRDQTLKQMLATKPTPHKASKKGKASDK